jgi:FkbM family methyltransferase
MSIYNTLRYLWTHPLTSGSSQERLRAFADFARWQIGSRLLPGPTIVPFVDDTVLVIERGMTGATGNLYSGLHEPESMGFVLHFLRPDDHFVDVGANVGSYTVLAGAAGARTTSFEPVPLAFTRLERNVSVNGLGSRVSARREGIGRASGRLLFRTDRDTANHVVAPGEPGADSAVEVPVTTLDEAIGPGQATLLKIDVEGMELEVVAGAQRVLSDPGLIGLSLELDHGRGYDVGEALAAILALGWTRVSYDPLTRTLTEHLAGSHVHGNLLFVRDVGAARARLAAAPRHRVRGRML